ncbi:MAG: hypothetical protein ACYCU8_00385 [Ferrimicrobium acidiphilum]
MGETTVPVHPAVFVDYSFGRGWHIVLSKDSNIGEVVLLFGSEFGSMMPSSGLVVLNLIDPRERFWLFGFLKHPSFREQLHTVVPRGATIAHAKELWLDCAIPAPDLASREFKWVSAAVQQISDWERQIRVRHLGIMDLFANAIGWSSQSTYTSETVSSSDVKLLGRLDTGLYSHQYRGLCAAISGHRGKWTRLSDLGIETRRGSNLAVSVIGASQYSTEEMPGWYRLIRPKSIAQEGILMENEWFGSVRDLPTVEAGQIIFGGEATWRSIVMCEGIDRCITNFHGTVIAWPDHELYETIWLRCWIEFLRGQGILKEIAVGGLGGSLGTDMYEHIPVPTMSAAQKRQIADLYFSSRPLPTDPLVWTRQAGIWQLDREAKALRARLEKVQDRILRGQPAGV